MLEAEQNVIIFSFSLKITGGLKYPAACNNEIFRQRYQAVITDYLEESIAVSLRGDMHIILPADVFVAEPGWRRAY